MFHPNGEIRKQQEAALRQLVSYINADAGWRYSTEIAYFLATVAHETGIPSGGSVHRTYLPIEERGGRAYFTRLYETNKRKARELGNNQIGDGARFHGRGYVQNTGRRNSEISGEVLAGTFVHKSLVEGVCDPKAKEAFKSVAGRSAGFTIQSDTFTKTPDLLLIPRISYMDATERIRDRRISFTKRIFSDYIHSETKFDFVNARKTINGTDKAGEIASLATAILAAVRFANQPTVESQPPQPTADGSSASVPASTPPEPSEEFHLDPFALKEQVSLARPLLSRTVIAAGTIWQAIVAFVVGLTLAQKIVLALVLAVVIGLIVFAFLKMKQHGVFPMLYERGKRWAKQKFGKQ